MSIKAIKLLARNDANVKTLVELGAFELLVELGRTGDKDEQYGKYFFRKAKKMK